MKTLIIHIHSTDLDQTFVCNSVDEAKLVIAYNNIKPESVQVFSESNEACLDLLYYISKQKGELL